MIRIRRVAPGDGRRMRAIRLQALTDSPGAFASTVEETRARPPEYWEQRVAGGEDSALYVAEDEDRWIGIVGVVQYELPSGPRAELISMWVSPIFRGTGVAARLVHTALDWARSHGLTAVTLWVTEGNGAAIRLYQRCGFHMTQETQPLPSDPRLRERLMMLELERPD